MMNLWQAFILGIIEGITEFLPISSTGHLILGARLLGLPETNFLKSFEITIQLGAILAVVVLYAKKLFLNKSILTKLLVAFLPTAIFGLLFYKLIKTYLLGNSYVVVIMLFLGGIILILFEHFHKQKSTTEESVTQISYKHCLLIGCIQVVAMIPGVSRSAATMIGGMILGYSRKTVVEFSFLLAIPTIAAATALDFLKNYREFSLDSVGILSAGFITSFITAFLAVKFLVSFVQKHTLIAFGVYRIVLAIIMFVVLF